MKNFTKIFTLSLAFLFLFSCTVQKKKGEEIKGVKKFYHNTTARYNGWFNADVLVTESMLALEAANQDNYNKLLELYPFMGAPDASSEKNNLDEAMKKVSVVVNLHRESDWTDDCYLLLGKAQFVKRSYEDAQQTFEFMEAEFSPKAIANKKKKKAGKKKGKSKKEVKAKNKEIKAKKKSRKKKKKKSTASSKGKKKKKSKSSYYSKKKKKKKKPTVQKPAPKEEIKKEVTKPKKVDPKIAKKKKEEAEEAIPDEDNGDGVLKHRPVWQDGKLWLARTYVKRDMFSEADYILEDMERDPKVYKEIRKELSKVRAYYFLEKKEFSSAATALEKVYNSSKDRTEKSRIAFILGQLFQKLNQEESSIAYFDKASKLSPNYELAFSAKLQIAQNEWNTGKSTGPLAIKKLETMLKDDKNRAYKDQVYFAMGQISLKEKDKPAATDYFKKSLAEGTNNRAQKAESYLALAFLYNDVEDFVSAKNYFDSTLTVLIKEDERYEQVEAYAENLKEIKENIEIVTLQDSLLRLSTMSAEEREKIAYQLKKKKDAEALARATNKTGARTENKSNNRPGTNVGSSALFWAYDDRALKKGERDFKKKYGDRVLEDNWRRSIRVNKGTSENVEFAEVTTNEKLTPQEISQLLKGMPETPQQLKAAEEKIAIALLRLGTLYREKLGRNDLSIKALERLANDYPGNVKEAEGWYNLYLAYKEDGQIANQKLYAQKIKDKYPKTIYAQIIGDPNFMDKANDKMMELSRYYDATYAKFVNHEYKAVDDRIKAAQSQFPSPNSMGAKFALLGAMTKGHTEGKDAYIKSLKEVVAKFPRSEEEKRAKEILRLLGEVSTAGVQDDTNTKASASFELGMDQVHYFIVALKNNSIKLADAKAKVSDYHRENYSIERLRISNIYLGADVSTPILVIRRFKNAEKSLEYFKSIEKDMAGYLGEGTEFEFFAVSQSNYRQILRTKTLNGYREFFTNNYL